ncbi:Serine hydroxymethyltransferase [seawater metagenome]|uniref:Serine hydroxymethyltransferase n=1 Tax=seawater metagenome TaxID=1561972 RepID=A0A5E8CL43_9ZZZZ
MKRFASNNFLKPLKKADTELYKIIGKEFKRQKFGLELIASENFTSRSVMDCLGSVLTNKYSEGYPGKRYYGGNQYIDQVENLCIQRAKKAYRLDENWGVNVQSYSGSTANMSTYLGLLNPHDRIMGLDLPSGGHLTHGFYTNKRKVSATSVVFESLPYKVDLDGLIDYTELEKLARIFKPKLLICGYSAYPRDLDYKKFREIADINNSILMCDMAHFSGFVAAKVLENPFEYCDIVTTTTHKTLVGPRAGMIFFKKEYENAINNSVFPGTQGGPHENTIAAIATQLKEVNTKEFKEYIEQVQKNSRTLANKMIDYGYKVCTNGTDNHIVLIDLRDKKISGNKIEKICQECDISINKNSVPGDTSALVPGGIRLGSAALTTRGLEESDFEQVGYFLNEVIKLAIDINKNTKNLEDFSTAIKKDDKVKKIRKKVKDFSKGFDFYK